MDEFADNFLRAVLHTAGIFLAVGSVAIAGIVVGGLLLRVFGL